MSSHHIVRDEQEPALLLLDYNPVNANIISNLLEWSPTVVTTTDMVEKFISQGFKIDIVLSPHDNLDKSKSLLMDHNPIKVISYNESDKPLDTAIFYLRGLKHSALNVITTGISSPLLSDYLESDFALCFYGNRIKWYQCQKGVFRKWVPQGNTFYFLDEPTSEISLGGRVVGFEKKDKYYQITCQSEGFIEVASESPYWLGEWVE